MKLLILLFSIFGINVYADGLFNISYTTSKVLANFTSPASYDQVFRYDKSQEYNRYEFSITNCKNICSDYGLGLSQESFIAAKYAESSPSYISYRLSSNYIYGTFKISKDVQKNLGVSLYGNIGQESLSIEKYSGVPNGSLSDSYIRTELGVSSRYYFAELPSVKVERVYLEAGALLYIKSMRNINFDNQSFGKINQGNILINFGIGFSF